jgi:hypothetical protein
MLALVKRFAFLAVAFLTLTVTASQAFATLYTLDAKDDAGLFFGESAYAQFASKANGGFLASLNLPNAPATAQPIFDAAISAGINEDWVLQSAGSVWSADNTVGDSYAYAAGTYRIDVVGGGFLYDSFSNASLVWSDAADVPPLWYMNIRAQEDSGVFTDTTLGPYLAKDAGTLPLYTYVTLNSPGFLDFWITDGNSIDNAGSLAFSVTSVPEPSTLPLLASIFPLFLLRVRKYLGRLAG